MDLNYNLLLKRKSQRKFHFYEHLTISLLPHIGEHIVVDEKRFVIVEIEHKFLSEVIDSKFVKTEQCGSIYAKEE